MYRDYFYYLHVSINTIFIIQIWMVPWKCVKFRHSDEKYKDFQLQTFIKRNPLHIWDIIPFSMNWSQKEPFKPSLSVKKSNVNFEIWAFFMPFVMEKVLIAFPTIIILQILTTTTIRLQLHPHFILWLGKNHSELYQWSNIVLKKMSFDLKMSVIKFS